MPNTIPPGWSQVDNALTRTITRANFVESLALTQEIGRLAEAADHHPDIDIRYRTVKLTLASHEAGNIVTEKDFGLAQQINDISEERIRLIAEELHLRFQA